MSQTGVLPNDKVRIKKDCKDTVRVDPDVLDACRIAAHEEGRTLSGFVSMNLRKILIERNEQYAQNQGNKKARTRSERA